MLTFFNVSPELKYAVYNVRVHNVVVTQMIYSWHLPSWSQRTVCIILLSNGSIMKSWWLGQLECLPYVFCCIVYMFCCLCINLNLWVYSFSCHPWLYTRLLYTRLYTHFSNIYKLFKMHSISIAFSVVYLVQFIFNCIGLVFISCNLVNYISCEL